MSKVKKILKPVAQIALPVVGGIFGGPAGAAIGGGLSGALGGGGLKGAALGAGLGALGAGALGTAAGAPVAGGIGPSAGSGILGSVTRAVPALGSLAGQASTALSGIGSSLSSMLGSAAGTPLSGGIGPTQGTGIIGGVTRGLGNAGLNTTASSGMFSNPSLSSILGGYLQTSGAEKQKDAIIEQLARSQAEYAPYKESGLAANKKLTELLGSGELGGQFTGEDLASDPGYQFRLGEGSKLLNQRLAAGGNYFSGDALKAAQQYGQGMASDEFQNAYNRDASRQAQLYNMLYGQQGLGAKTAADLANLYGDEASARSGAYAAKTNALSQMLGGF